MQYAALLICVRACVGTGSVTVPPCTAREHRAQHGAASGLPRGTPAALLPAPRWGRKPETPQQAAVLGEKLAHQEALKTSKCYGWWLLAPFYLPPPCFHLPWCFCAAPALSSPPPGASALGSTELLPFPSMPPEVPACASPPRPHPRPYLWVAAALPVRLQIVRGGFL